ncbi:MAG: 16S rRNA (cytosine(967)-C(5))-methyltransferase RsmB [Candidatus Syntrophonatronum acetioxidans]|uniref:16S rRNA (cytosine(967)-C(5))-methyltransferase n=1 Tax=Candidatus Syntrophonatronum acetioxidans TaxID=1795816 RepID=A0A424YHS5_9FIRM|nr:MAG: 16S rRNA (cytosine(967)-C(5))-methyltransferase RsmB [Candidatus Syntrophonatronum acetioxidans]
MSKDIKAREVALNVLHEVDVKGAYLDLSLKRQLLKSNLGERDRALVTEICYGVIRYLLTLDWYMEKTAGRKISKIDPMARNILRLSLYQLIYLKKIPAAAACYEGVEIAKKTGHKGQVKFVNGLLRGFLRKKGEAKFPAKEENPLKHLSIKYSYPSWMVERWASRFGLKECEEILECNNQRALLNVRVNTLKIRRDKLIEILEIEGIEAQEGFLPESLILKGVKSLSKLDSFKKGLFQVQSQSSMLVSRILDPQPGEIIMDSCSAPGGKASHLAQLMDNKGRIVCRDIYPHKVRLIKKNARRLGINILEPEVGDSRKISASSQDTFHRILVDAPCSGLGIIRRKPDLKWKRKLDDIRELSRLQKELLREASRFLKPGGILLYSVCTNEAEETEEVFQEFCQGNKNFAPSDFSNILPEGLKVDGGGKGFLNLFPHRHGLDGFFIARWIKG